MRTTFIMLLLLNLIGCMTPQLIETAKGERNYISLSDIETQVTDAWVSDYKLIINLSVQEIEWEGDEKISLPVIGYDKLESNERVKSTGGNFIYVPAIVEGQLTTEFSKPLSIVEITESSEIDIPENQDAVIYVQYRNGSAFKLGYKSRTPLIENTYQLGVDLDRTYIYSGRINKKPYLYVLMPLTALWDIGAGTVWLFECGVSRSSAECYDIWERKYKKIKRVGVIKGVE